MKLNKEHHHPIKEVVHKIGKTPYQLYINSELASRIYARNSKSKHKENKQPNLKKESWN